LKADAARLEADAVVSADLAGLHAVLDVGAVADNLGGTGADDDYLTIAGGLSYHISEELNAGVEAYGEIGLSDSTEDPWAAVGPCFTFTHGRFWLTASMPIGLGGQAPDLLPRVIWAVAF